MSLSSKPTFDNSGASGRCGERGVVLRAESITKHFPAGRRSVIRAVDGVDLTIAAGEAVGLVGESGSGKSTFARCVMRLTNVTHGRNNLQGVDLTRLSQRQLRGVRTQMQMVFQDPLGAWILGRQYSMRLTNLFAD